jgi:hypothetical protein
MASAAWAQVGWIFGPPWLLAPTSRAHSRIAFCVATPLQVRSPTQTEHASLLLGADPDRGCHD